MRGSAVPVVGAVVIRVFGRRVVLADCSDSLGKGPEEFGVIVPVNGIAVPVVAIVQPMAGVVPPLEVMGAEPVTPVTPCSSAAQPTAPPSLL